MKHYLALTLTVLLLVACNKTPEDTQNNEDDPIIPPAANEENNDQQGITSMRRYGIESGKVVYKVTGSMMEGTEELYFDDWGKKEAKYTKLNFTVPGIPAGAGEQQTITIMKDGYIYTVDEKTGQSSKMQDNISTAMVDAADVEDMEELGKLVMEKLGGTEGEPGNILGYACTNWVIDAVGATNCVYKGVSLGVETNLGEMSMSYMATEAEFDIAIPAEKFEVPESAGQPQEVDVDAMMDMINDL